LVIYDVVQSSMCCIIILLIAHIMTFVLTVYFLLCFDEVHQSRIVNV